MCASWLLRNKTGPKKHYTVGSGGIVHNFEGVLSRTSLRTLLGRGVIVTVCFSSTRVLAGVLRWVCAGL